MRSDGVKLSVTPQFMALFYDITVHQATAVLCLSDRTMRRLRVWCGLSRWPRQLVLENRHPVLTTDAVRQERRSIMKWAWEQRDSVLYGMLYHAHKLAGCRMAGIPAPPVAPGVSFCAFPDPVVLPAAASAAAPAAASAAVAPAPAAVQPAAADPDPAAEEPGASAAAELDFDWGELLTPGVSLPSGPGGDDCEDWQAFLERTAQEPV
jgi:pyruvate/2-oxoglutarate dehydrogenase complex dihydrolipoamide acyltransferase (E2) component